MTITFVRHQCADYATWRAVYDSVAEVQRQGGVIREAVYCSENDPNEVLVMHEFGSSEEAHAFMNSPDLHKALADSGVDPASVRVEFYEPR